MDYGQVRACELYKGTVGTNRNLWRGIVLQKRICRRWWLQTSKSRTKTRKDGTNYRHQEKLIRRAWLYIAVFKSEWFGLENTWWLNFKELLDLLRGLGAVTVPVHHQHRGAQTIPSMIKEKYLPQDLGYLYKYLLWMGKFHLLQPLSGNPRNPTMGRAL